MDINNRLNALKEIKPVAAPPFLFTRIKAQIQNLESAPAPVKWMGAFALSAVLVVALDLSVVLHREEDPKKAGMEMVGRAMELSNSNALYHE